MTAYTASGILCSIAALGLCFAIGADWRNMRPPWRAVLLAGTVEQGVLAYLSLDLGRLDGVGLAVGAEVVFLASVSALAVAVLIALVIGWRSGELTSPTPREVGRDTSR